jgi:mRNA interferase YafQ
MLAVVLSTSFGRDVKRAQRRGKDLKKLEAVITLLQNRQPLPERCRDHPLKGEWQHYRDCHIEPDRVLIYRIEGQQLFLARTGTHADL